MKVVVDGKEMETKARRIRELMEELSINPETVVVRKNGEIVLDEEEIEEGDEIDFLRVVSGG